MTNATKNYNCEELFNLIEQKTPLIDREQATEFAIKKHLNYQPVYVHTLNFIGAFFATIFLLFTIGLAGIFELQHPNSMIITGAFFLILSFVIYKNASSDEESPFSFGIQTLLCFIGIGKGLIVFGVYLHAESQWILPLALGVLTIITYPFCKLSLDRFFSSYLTLSFIFTNLMWNKSTQDINQYLFDGFMIIHLIAIAGLFFASKKISALWPLFYAFVFSLCKIMAFLTAPNELSYSYFQNLPTFYLVNALHVAGFIALIWYLTGSKEKFLSPPILLAILLVVVLGYFSAASFLLGVMLLILGYGEHDKALLGLGAVLTPLFLILYYYNLHITLLEKSIILFASGVTLLAARAYIRYNKWDQIEPNKGENSCAS